MNHIIELLGQPIIIIEWRINNNITYDEMVDILIKSQKIKYMYPNYNIGCKIMCDKQFVNKYINNQFYDLLYSSYDFIVADVCDVQLNMRNYIPQLTIKQLNKYIKKSNNLIIDSTSLGLNEHSFDHDYEYYLLKQKLGPNKTNNFMFREYDLMIEQRGGFNPEHNNIVFKKKYEPNLNIIKTLYDLKYVNKNQISFYHIDKQHRYRPFNNVSPMINTDKYDDNHEFNYLYPIKKLAEYHKKDSYYEKLFNRVYKSLNENIRLNLIDDNDISSQDKDSIITQYIKCKPNSYIITIWKPAYNGIDKFINLLEEHGKILYVKTLSLSKNGLRNLMFWYYDDFNYADTVHFIDKKLEYVDTKEDNNPVCVIVFENIHNKKLSGQKAEFKEFLRTKLLDFSDLDKTKYWGNDIMHINDYFYQTIEYSQLLFNQNSLNVLEKQDCTNFLTFNFLPSNLKMQTLRKTLYSNISLLELDRMITLGGCSLYAHGARSFGDIDSVFIDSRNKAPQLDKFVDDNFGNKSTKIKFMDSSVIGSSSWHDSWTIKNKIITNKMNIDNFNDMVLDPKNFFYHQGIKFVTLEFELLRKLNRNSVTDHIDFIMINLLYPELIKDYVILQNNDEDIDFDKYNKIDSDKYFMYNNKYMDIVGKFDDRFKNVKLKKLTARYSKKQIEFVKQFKIFNDFMNDI